MPELHRATGSKNFKYTLRNAAPDRASAEALQEYAALCRHVLEDNAVTSEEVEELESARGRLGISLKEHATVVRSLGVSPAQFQQLLRAQSPDGEQGAWAAFLALVDVDGDGLISFSEYIFFVALLVLSDAQLAHAFREFDTSGDAMLDAEAFQAAMRAVRNKFPLGRAVTDPASVPRLLGGRPNAASVDRALVLPRFFGADGSRKLSLDDFLRFVRQLRLAVHALEFEIHSQGLRYLSPLQFAAYLTSHASEEQARAIAIRADAAFGAGRGEGEMRIARSDFLAFCEFLEHLDEAEAAMARALRDNPRKHGLTADELVACAKDGRLGLNVAKVLVACFDANGDGLMDPAEFIALAQLRKTRGAVMQERDLGVVRRLRGLASSVAVGGR